MILIITLIVIYCIIGLILGLILRIIDRSQEGFWLDLVYSIPMMFFWSIVVGALLILLIVKFIWLSICEIFALLWR